MSAPWAWWAAADLGGLPWRERKAGEKVVELGEVDRLVLDVQGEVEVVLERLAATGDWFPVAHLSGTGAAYVGPYLPIAALLTRTVRVRWSAGLFALTLRALPPSARTHA